MSDEASASVTRLLEAVAGGDDSARQRLWTLIYDELRVMARRQLADESAGHRRQPTSLVQDAYLRLTRGAGGRAAERAEFFAAAAGAMRRIRIDDARSRGRLKRGGNRSPVPLHEGLAAEDQDSARLPALDEALTRLEAKDPRKAQVVMLRFFAGLTVEECAEVLGVSPRTVEKEWRFARTWLHSELSDGHDFM